MRPAIVLACVAALLLTACASAPGIPETSYFRLPQRAALEPLPSPAFEAPVVVDTFLADGLHSSQAILYATDAEATQLRAYHYQLWVDPPVRMLQQRLIRSLRQAKLAPLVVDRLAAHDDAVRVTGRIQRFERVPAGEGWSASVALLLRVDVDGEARPRLVRRYREDVRAEGSGIADSVRAFGVALERIQAAFVADVAAAAGGGHDAAADDGAGDGDDALEP